jgi:drug/metabolite transporter (DMT)-like permease
MKVSFVPYVVLLVGVLVVSTSAILIRLAQEQGMPSLTIAAGRLTLAVLLLTPLAWARAGHELRRLTRRDLLLALGAGFFLALHFAAWISSLAYTSVASSTALVTTNPLWVGLASWLVLGERPGRGTVGGLVLTLAGSGLIILSGMSARELAAFENPTLGNLLALLGAITVSAYLLIGRGLRRRMSVLAYIWLVYTTAAVLVSAWVLLRGLPVLGFSPLAYLWLLALALGPQLLGHTSFNWALRYLSATFIAIAVLAEPVSASVIAWFVFSEGVEPLQLAGFVLLLLGIYIASRDETTPTPTPTAEPEPEPASSLPR